MPCSNCHKPVVHRSRLCFGCRGETLSKDYRPAKRKAVPHKQPFKPARVKLSAKSKPTPFAAIKCGIDLNVLAQHLDSYREQVHDRRSLGLYADIEVHAPKWLLDNMRQELVSEVFISILAGEFSDAQLDKAFSVCLKRVRKFYPDKWRHVSIDAPMFSDGRRTLAETLVG